MATTMTKVQKFTAIADYMTANGVTFDGFDVNEFLAHEVELLNSKKASPKKPSKVQLENDACKADILAFLATVDKPQTVKEIQSGVPSLADMSNQRITHMLTDLRKAKEVARSYVKKVAYFALGAEPDAE